MEKEVKDGRGLTQAAAESIVADADERIRYRQELRDRAVSKINELVANLQSEQDAIDFLDAVEVQVQEDGKPIVPRFVIDQAFFDLSDEGRLLYDRVTMTVSRPAELLDNTEVEYATSAIAQVALAKTQGGEGNDVEAEGTRTGRIDIPEAVAAVLVDKEADPGLKEVVQTIHYLMVVNGGVVGQNDLYDAMRERGYSEHDIDGLIVDATNRVGYKRDSQLRIVL